MIKQYNKTYIAAGGSNEVVASGRAILHSIIFGADVGSSVVEVSDSATDGDGNIKIKLSGATLMTSTGGTVFVGALFADGITLDIVNQTDITVIWEVTA